MNNIKKLIISYFLIFIILSISCVSASEISNSTGNFTQLNHEIISANDNIEITKNYTYLTGENEIELNKSIDINGNDKFIDCSDHIELFKISDNVSVTFKNIYFKNLYSDSFKTNGNYSNVLLINCTILDYKQANSSIEILNEQEFSYSCAPTPEIIKMAKKIVGKSKDIDAAKKLAKWINTNIKHEVNEGFYQSPSETLKLKKGNCCCHAELFLQMCDAIGLTKNHMLGFVHVGSLEFQHRHFFAIFDNICVDCDCIFSNPWGHGKFSGRDVYQVTMYPLLPLKKTY